MLEAEQPDLEEIGAALDDIARDNARAVDIVAQVRALFQRGEASPSPVDLRQVLFDTEKLLRHEAMLKKIALRVVAPDALPTISGHRTQLVQLLLNLMLNAFDAIVESEAEVREVEIRADAGGSGQVRVAVRDSGGGIDPKNLPRLFDAFFTTREKGIGLGLAIARSIAENHGGRLWAQSNADRGATMHFELPVDPPSTSEA
jgi:two-component system sensor kinase FixL